jgi:site-specific DNA recombinase
MPSGVYPMPPDLAEKTSNVPAPQRRVAVYARVSTTRQAEQDLSLPDQLAYADTFCIAKGWTVIERFIEPGASATDDRRPEFQKLVDRATQSERPFDIVLVHSMSRFFRDQFQSEFYIRKLRKCGVEVVSITQQFENDPTGNLLRQFLGLFDEYQSRENSKHTLRAMRENARQDFWNGAHAPFGYEIVEAERRGATAKKRPAILETEAVVVRQIYDLAIGRHGPTLGVKAIVNRLNGEGITFRGKPFHISSVHRILTSRTYIGEHVFNRRCAKTGESKPSADWIISAMPAIIDEADFELIHANLEARNPKRTPPRVVSGPTLLTGIARCGSCDSGMTIRTGKSGRYRYYVCAGCAQKGKTFCAGRSVSMPKLDRAVTTHLAEHLFNKARLKVILQAYLEQSDQMRADRTRRSSILKTRQTEISGKIGRLLQMVANGIMESDDPDLADQTRQLKAQRHQVSEELLLLEQSSAAPDTALTESRLARFADVMKAAMASEDPGFRKAYLRLFVDTVTVNDAQIELTGPKSALAKAAGQDNLPAAAAVVPSFVRAWRPVGDSNPCYRRERAASWASRRTGRGGVWLPS